MRGSFEEILMRIVRAIIIISVVMALSILCMLNYQIGLYYCEYMGISKDISLTIVSPSRAIEVSIVMLILEFFILHFVIKALRNIKRVNELCNFLTFVVNED